MSMPASRSAVNADGGARKVNSFDAGEPPVVIAVSRLTIVRSALLSTAAAGPKTVSGSAASRSPTRSMKCTSPAKDIVKTPGDAVEDAPVDVVRAGCEDVGAGVVPAGGAGASVTPAVFEAASGVPFVAPEVQAASSSAVLPTTSNAA